MKGESEPEGEGRRGELGEEWKLRGTASLGKGLNLPTPQRILPLVSSLGAWGLLGHLCPFVQAV